MKPYALFAIAGLCVVAAAIGPAPKAMADSCAAEGAVLTRHAICSNPAAVKTDVQMAAAFAALLGQSTPTDQQVFRDSQKYWLDDRDTDCDFTDATEKPAKPAAIAKCAAGENQQRYRFLAGLPDEGPGASDKIVPVMREGQGFVWSFHFADPATPAEKLVNGKLDAEVAGLHIGKINDDTDFTDSFDAELKYASPAFLSASVEGEHESPGGTNNQPIAYNLNVDMQTGALFTFADAFAPELLPKLQALCASQLGEYVKPSANQSAADVAADVAHLNAAVADLGQWSFGARRATITMDPGDEDPYQCHYDYAPLRKLIKPGFPLPTS